MSAVFPFKKLSSSLNKMRVCIMLWVFFVCLFAFVSGRDPMDLSSLHNVLVK